MCLWEHIFRAFGEKCRTRFQCHFVGWPYFFTFLELNCAVGLTHSAHVVWKSLLLLGKRSNFFFFLNFFKGSESNTMYIQLKQFTTGLRCFINMPVAGFHQNTPRSNKLYTCIYHRFVIDIVKLAHFRFGSVSGTLSLHPTPHSTGSKTTIGLDLSATLLLAFGHLFFCLAQ